MANGITGIRIVCVLILIFCPTASTWFLMFYLVGGISDVLDGFIARKLHTESEKGAMLDSVADLFFWIVYAAKILPLLSIPFWIWIWTAIIAATKVTGMVIAGKKADKFWMEHSFGNKLTGLLLFFLPFSVHIADVKYPATFVCIAATVTAIQEIIKICGGSKNAI